MGREMRRVPADWQHPRDRAGRYIPLFDGYEQAAKEWDKAHTEWLNGTHPDQAVIGAMETDFEQYHGARPRLGGSHPTTGDYMPDFPVERRTHYQLYETTSEGTPASPVFATLDELCEYAETNCTTFADFKASKEDWKRMLQEDFVRAEAEMGGKRIVFL